jgi:hypothetical protein
MRRLSAASLAALLAAPAAAAGHAQPTATIASPKAAEGTILVERDTVIRLMVLNEVSSRTAGPGHRFVLRVDEPVVVGGVTVIPTGAKAWGEVMDSEKSGSVGKGGRISARLLYLESGDERIPISGESKAKGDKGSTQVAMGMFGLGPLALLAPGNNAKLKAGEIFSAYLEADMLFDPATARLRPLAGAKDQ